MEGSQSDFLMQEAAALVGQLFVDPVRTKHRVNRRLKAAHPSGIRGYKGVRTPSPIPCHAPVRFTVNPA
jgi:hypothetical protein